MANGMRVLGKVVIVTGGARGMGESHAKLLVAHGARVVISDILTEEGQVLANAIGSNAAFICHDVTSRDSWRNVVEEAEKVFGPVSVLINNAGIFDMAPIETMTEEAYRRVIDINQISVFLGMQAIIASMRRAGGGSIINVSSTAGFVGMPQMLGYVASKFAVRGMTKVAALELGKDRIRVNSVHPGSIATPMLAGAREPVAQPIARLGQPAEVSSLILYLASDESSYCTGSEFVVDGGLLCAVGEVVI